MNAIERFKRGELLGAKKLNGVVDALNTLVGVRASVPHVRLGAHQAERLRMPVEPAGGLYDKRRGLGALADCLSEAQVAESTAWLGHAPGVQTAGGRVSGGDAAGQVFCLAPAEGGTLWQQVRTNSAGCCVQTCVVYKGPGCAPPASRFWNWRANEGGVMYRALGRVVSSPLAYASCCLPRELRYEVLHEHDFMLPVVTQGARTSWTEDYDGYAQVLDASRAQTPVVRNVAVHAPEGDFSLTSTLTEVVLWENQTVPAAPGGHVWRGRGAVNGTVGVLACEVKWWGHSPAVATVCGWRGAADMQQFACDQGSMPERTVWQRIQTDQDGFVSCVALCVVDGVDYNPPGAERYWVPDRCAGGQLYRRVGHVVQGRAVTDIDYRLPILTQNAVVRDDMLQSKGVKLLQEPSDSSQNRFVKRLVSCVGCLRLVDLGCAVAIRGGLC